MALAEDIFERMAWSLKIDGPVHDRRILPRAHTGANVVMIPLQGVDHGLPTRVSVRDISADGISIIYPRAMPKDAGFIVELPRKGDKPTAMLCRVRYSRMIGADQFSIGGRFEKCVVIDE